MKYLFALLVVLVLAITGWLLFSNHVQSLPATRKTTSCAAGTSVDREHSRECGTVRLVGSPRQVARYPEQAIASRKQARIYFERAERRIAALLDGCGGGV